MTEHQFGGKWTEQKLGILEGYLKSYLSIFTNNPRASWFRTYYVDAFAGTGARLESGASVPLLQELEQDADLHSLKRGSAAIALDLDPGFDRYVFIEQNPRFAAELRDRVRHSGRSSEVIEGEANHTLTQWLARIDWGKSRAVAFLDPYGMQVNWATLERIAATGAIDLWLLFPLGQAVIRLLTQRPPEGGWADRLTSFFGTGEWRTEFYRQSAQGDLFGATTHVERDVRWDSIESFFRRRLETLFPAVSPKPRRLLNSVGTPIYLLFFAAANPKGARTAMRIASHLLERF